MQTFLPFAGFEESARCLDTKRLGKQRIEAYKILEIINGKESRWSNHPAVKMWIGYYVAICREWISRGYNHTMPILIPSANYAIPDWLGHEKFHSKHRATLLSKNFDHYSQFNWKETPKYEYWWPT